MNDVKSPPAPAPAPAVSDSLHDHDWNPAILEDLHALLADLGSGPVDDTIEAQLRELESDHGDIVYSELLYLLSHLRFQPAEAKPHWESIVEHRRSMQHRLGSPVDLRVALVSYFVEVNHQIKNPKIIEMKLFERERASAYRDELTGLYNYRMFREQLAREIARTARCAAPLSLVMIDVDHFKEYNDTNGHEAGNRALAVLAGLLKGALRESDFAARYGGEEFVLLLPSTPKTSAHVIAERTREAVELHGFEGESNLTTGELTVSIGVATHPADAEQPTSLVRHADRALYLAKAAGRNQVVLYGHSRRSHGRISVEVPGTLRTLRDETHSLTTVNISEAGVLFRTEQALRHGSLIELSMQTDPDRIVTAACRVIHVENGGDGTYRTAVEITGARNADRARLMKLVRDALRDELP